MARGVSGGGGALPQKLRRRPHVPKREVLVEKVPPGLVRRGVPGVQPREAVEMPVEAYHEHQDEIATGTSARGVAGVAMGPQMHVVFPVRSAMGAGGYREGQVPQQSPLRIEARHLRAVEDEYERQAVVARDVDDVVGPGL